MDELKTTIEYAIIPDVIEENGTFTPVIKILRDGVLQQKHESIYSFHDRDHAISIAQQQAADEAAMIRSVFDRFSQTYADIAKTPVMPDSFPKLPEQYAVDHRDLKIAQLEQDIRRLESQVMGMFNVLRDI